MSEASQALATLLDVITPWLSLRALVAALLLRWVLRTAYRIFVYPYWVSPLRHIPGPPLEGFVMGHVYTYNAEEPGLAERPWAAQHGPVVRTVGPIGIERVAFLRPEALHTILVSDWIDNPRPKYLRNILGMSAGYGLLTATGDAHKQMRKVISPAFSLAHLMAQADMYYDPIFTLINLMKNQMQMQGDPSRGKVMNMYEWMSKVTLDIICESAFGYHSNSLLNPNNELTEAYEDLLGLQSPDNFSHFAMLVTIPGMPAFLLSKLGYRFRRVLRLFRPLVPAAIFTDAAHRLRAIARKILEERLAGVVSVEDSSTKKDIMTLLIRARSGDEKTGHQMSDEDLVDHMLTFLGAGHETTASGLSWALWLLANHPASQSKLRAEVAPVFRGGARPDYRTLRDLKMLDCVVQESLRLYAPVPLTVRIAARDGTIDGVRVPRGTLLPVPIRTLNTARAVWGADAEAFHPERWLAPHPPATMTFLAGPHACIGKTMSVAEMKAVLGALIANFEFAPSRAGQCAQPVAAITMKPQDGMPLLVSPVSSG
ncbi:cytochrome P450 [Gloeopeniophorella convolvens]|nr:cytochrome P450 [Gloeopeniophorella convolvens]